MSWTRLNGRLMWLLSRTSLRISCLVALRPSLFSQCLLVFLQYDKFFPGNFKYSAILCDSTVQFSFKLKSYILSKNSSNLDTLTKLLSFLHLSIRLKKGMSKAVNNLQNQNQDDTYKLRQNSFFFIKNIFCFNFLEKKLQVYFFVKSISMPQCTDILQSNAVFIKLICKKEI